jgi:biotin carboxyl carrier protein
MKYKFVHGNNQYTIMLEKYDMKYRVTIDDAAYDITDVVLHENVVSCTRGGALCTTYVVENRNKLHVACGSDHYVFDIDTGVSSRTPGSTVQRGDSVCSPMPGLVVKIPVAVGDQIAAGTILAIVEAMKMQNELLAPRDGIVKSINFKEGDQVDALQPIVELES